MAIIAKQAYFISPPIVLDGLVVLLDAANQDSYASGSSMWYNLPNRSYSGSLYNTPTYNAGNIKYLNFSSTALQSGAVSTLGNLPTWTVEVFVQFTADYSSKIASIVTGQYDGGSNVNFTIGTNNAPTNYNIAVGFFDGAWHSTTGVQYDLNTWFHIVGTYDGNTIKQFTNSTLVDSLNYVGTPASGGEVYINRRWDSPVLTGNLLDTNIALIKIYNRALTNAEILQNYNAHKARFGLL